MFTLRALAVSVVTAVVPVGIHFMIQVSAAADRLAVDYLSSKKQAALDAAGGYLGYQRRVEIEQHTVEDLAEKEALVAGLNPALVRAVMRVESAGDKFAESPQGARSLMQVMPANYKRCELEHHSQLWQPEINVRCGVRILAEEMRTYKGDVLKALVAYNAGAKGVTGAYPSAVQYAQNVVNLMAKDIR